MLLFQEPAEFNWSSQTQGVVVVEVVETLLRVRTLQFGRYPLLMWGHK